MWIANEIVVEMYEDVLSKIMDGSIPFDRFKQNPVLQSLWFGSGNNDFYSAFIARDFNKSSLLKYADAMLLNDSLGNPRKSIAKINDNLVGYETMRYMHTAMLIENSFGSLNDKTICEFGIAYGGLSYVLQCVWTPKKYYVVDLPIVQAFAKSYVNRLGKDICIEPAICNPDLFISEYGISEMRNYSDYYEKYVGNARNAFIRINFDNQKHSNDFIKLMKDDFKEVTVEEEKPNNRKPNMIVIGKGRKYGC